MQFNLNEFLMAVSFALDFVEIDISGRTSNHGKRTAYIALKIASELGLRAEELHDIVALAILHDNGVSEKSLHDKLFVGDYISVNSIERVKEHCIIGEENVKEYPFLTDVKNVIKYHHENHDGTGFFGLKGKDTPLISQIIHIADALDINFDFKNGNIEMHDNVLSFVNEQKNQIFSPKVVGAFLKVAQKSKFWTELKDESIDDALKNNTPQYSLELSFYEIKKITGVFSKIIDSKSKYTQRHSRDLSEKAAIMADYYKMDHDDKIKLVIAADLHDIGKLAVPNKILDSPSKLTAEEFHIVKNHPYYTRIALQGIKGFEDITEWAANHHEKLNGKGYPFGKTAESLDVNSRLMACLDIYEALTEDRPYRISLKHSEAMEILHKMKDDGLIDDKITKDIDYVFSRKN